MNHIFYSDFDNLLNEYRDPSTREDKLIKHKLDSIVALYDSCGVEEREFADEITLEFSRIIAILKNQHRQELMEITQKCQELEKRQENLPSSYIPLHRQDQGDTYEYDYEVLADFYDHFRRPEDDQLSYWQIDGYQFENEEHRKSLVNLTMWDYCNRIKTFAKKYLYEIYPEESIPRVIHGEDADDYETYEPIVFVYNNLELILAKMKTTNENGETVKQRLNIRSALRKLNEFKQEFGNSPQMSSFQSESSPFAYACILDSDKSIEEAYIYYLVHYYKKEKLTKTDISNACPQLRKLWQSFCNAYKNGDLPKELSDDFDEGEIYEDVLVNVHVCFDMLNAYCGMMKASAGKNDIWIGFEKELDRFVDFMNFAKSH
jgi:hypothetical protein